MWTPDRPVLVIEPHADDAFLSLGGHIEAWTRAGARVTIATVFSGTRRRGPEAARYAEAVGAEWVGLGLIEAGGLAGPPRPQLAAADLADLAPGALYIGPLGLGHPEHRAVAAARAPADLAYVDQPYAARPSRTAETTEALTGALVVSWYRPRATKLRHAGLFRDQARYFHYNPPARLAAEITEVIVQPAQAQVAAHPARTA